MQLSATPDCTAGASPQDGGALSTSCVDVNDLILQQVVGGGAATNRMSPIDKKKKDVKKQGDFKYIFIL